MTRKKLKEHKQQTMRSDLTSQSTKVVEAAEQLRTLVGWGKGPYLDTPTVNTALFNCEVAVGNLQTAIAYLRWRQTGLMGKARGGEKGVKARQAKRAQSVTHTRRRVWRDADGVQPQLPGTMDKTA